jgi:hypothetical protein
LPIAPFKIMTRQTVIDAGSKAVNRSGKQAAATHQPI